jgi:N-acetylmuramic acid 6-phosphate etherase
VTAPGRAAASTDLPPTERRNPATLGLADLGTEALLAALNDEDARVAPAVRAVLPQVAELVELAVQSLRAGGAVHYLGAGTSGRLAALDAVELRPTFGAPPRWFTAHLAGGPQAMTRAVEGAEDDRDDGARVVREHVRPGDLVVGVAASGRTPWVLGGLEQARRQGAATGLVCADPGARAGEDVDVLVGVATGPEALTGSTRMKAGTAQKLVLNAFSTATMVRMGRAWSNLMVDLVATNAKLRERSVRILVEASGEDESACAAALVASGGRVKVALVSLLADVDADVAATALEGGDGHVASALRALRPA